MPRISYSLKIEGVIGTVIFGFSQSLPPNLMRILNSTGQLCFYPRYQKLLHGPPMCGSSAGPKLHLQYEGNQAALPVLILGRGTCKPPHQKGLHANDLQKAYQQEAAR